ncbi:hypothetical protein J6590_101466 [Homalodisca vitripennis]|nr:hypothetical protein J6590_101466 [Homalodisca vitripennis]
MNEEKLNSLALPQIEVELKDLIEEFAVAVKVRSLLFLNAAGATVLKKCSHALFKSVYGTLGLERVRQCIKKLSSTDKHGSH